MSDGRIAEALPKAGGGHPTKQSIQQLRLTIASGPLWYPGKAKPGAQKRGRKPKLTEAKRLRVAKSATSLKTSGQIAPKEKSITGSSFGFLVIPEPPRLFY